MRDMETAKLYETYLLTFCTFLNITRVYKFKVKGKVNVDLYSTLSCSQL